MFTSYSFSIASILAKVCTPSLKSFAVARSGSSVVAVRMVFSSTDSPYFAW